MQQVMQYLDMFQKTIKYPVSCYGIGVHSGQTVQITLKPARADSGIIFIRTDISGENHVLASYSNVSETSLSTTISNKNLFSISTIEHLMAAIWGSDIDNIIIEIDGPEVPIMDGSSKPFVFMLDCAQPQILNAKRKYLKILREVTVSGDKGSENIVLPNEAFMVDINIDFASKAIGKQSLQYNNKMLFNTEIAAARTFGFVEELDYLQNNGLARGASLNNAIGIDKDIILNHDGLRFKDEFVKHKLLDAIGDISLGAQNIIGNFILTKPGHNINNLLLRKIFDNPNNYCWITL